MVCPVLKNTAGVRAHRDSVTSYLDTGKGVFANQLKCTIGEVMDYKIHTLAGDEVDAIFAYLKISARIVNSPIIMGTTITLLNVLADRMVKVYYGQ